MLCVDNSGHRVSVVYRVHAICMICVDGIQMDCCYLFTKLHPVVAFPPPPPPPSSEDHRRLYYPLGVLSDVRHSPSRFWVSAQPPPPPPMPPPSAPSLCSSASEVICSAFSADIGTWPFRNQLPPPPPNVSASMGFAVGGPFEELPPCDQYSNSFGSSPLVADPPSHPQYRSAALGSQPYSTACDAYPSGSADYSEMTAYEAPYFSELPSQSEMTGNYLYLN